MRKLALLAACLWSLSTASLHAGTSVRYQSIPSFDGTAISAVVLTPSGQGPGPFPLIVMPSSWGIQNLEYVGRGAVLASQGYVVISYTSRGFWESGGQIDIAGTATVRDVSSVIDWALANTPSRADAIGASGISYGAGTSLLAAERDPRIRAVAALSGWGDLVASLYPNQTPSQQAIALLVGLGLFTGRPGPELAALSQRVLVNDYQGAVDTFLPIAASRSPITAVNSLNTNGTAVFLANAFGDGLFTPNQYVRFFNALTGPKQLMFAHGDHATVELPGALGLPNEVYTAVTRWFDFHLKRAANGVGGEPKVKLKSQNGTWRSYADWNAVQNGRLTYSLTRPSGLVPTGGFTSAASTGWSYGVAAGVPSGADSGVVILSGLMQGLGLPTTASIPLVNRLAGAVWTGPVSWSSQHLSGTPTVRFTLTPSRANASAMVYLYSVDLLGIGDLVTSKPVTLRNVTPGAAQTLTVDLEATSWDIGAGRYLALVIDTVDARFTMQSPLGATVSFSSPASAPAQLVVPLR
ncbi:MAG: X-Pro dipeptidyl-peptidase [Verrucomicrobia bacterium]|nr:X-Pro dipeptidyl-peptidase [Verrucomicrobiota bacterium]